MVLKINSQLLELRQPYRSRFPRSNAHLNFMPYPRMVMEIYGCIRAIVQRSNKDFLVKET